MLTVARFRDSLSGKTPPPALPPVLVALWWAGRQDWDRAHDVVQGHEGEADCDLIHAHLHRQEGDTGNARYWYRRAGRAMPGLSISDEWAALVAEFVGRAEG